MKDSRVLYERLYRQMYLIRRSEERLLSAFSEGLLNGTTHTSIGQEACAVGVIDSLNLLKDMVVSNHRCHGHFIALGHSVESLFAEVMGRESGACRGMGGSQHLHAKGFYSNGILGGTLAAATGMAFAEKKCASGAVVVCFIGDGTMGEGVVYESLNMASLWNLPLLIVQEDNKIAQTTPASMQHAGNIEGRANAFGIVYQRVVADDVLKVRQSALEAMAKVRKDSHPYFLHLETDRLAPHSKGDDTRSAQEIEKLVQRDHLVPARKVAEDMGIDVIALETAVHKQVDDSFAVAHASPKAQWETILPRIKKWDLER